MHAADFAAKHPIALNVFFKCTLVFSLKMKRAGEIRYVCTQANTATPLLYYKCV